MNFRLNLPWRIPQHKCIRGTPHTMEALHREKALLGHYATVRRGSNAFTLLPSNEEKFEKNIHMLDF